MTPMSSWPSRSENSGTMSGARIAIDAATASHGCRETPRAQVSQRVRPSGRFPIWRNPGTRSRFTPLPTNERIAGISVIEVTTAVRTAIAAASPSVVTRGMPATASDTSAITTVLPAKTIALPEDETARATDSRIGMPASSWSLCRVTRNSA